LCLILCLVSLQTCAVGCHTCWPSADLTFRALDARTRQPVAGVRAKRSGTGNTLLAFPVFPGEEGTFPLPPSGSDGIIVANKLCNDLSHAFVFEQAGYLPAHANWNRGDRILLDLPPTDPHHNHQGQFASAKGPIDVLMYPQDTPVAAYAPVWTETPDVPPEVLQLAESTRRREHPRESNDWHDQTGARHTFRNQYGDHAVLWMAKSPSTPGFRWEWVQITNDGSLNGHVTGTTPKPPTPESLEQDAYPSRFRAGSHRPNS
jgi:hypothetical protein